MGFLAAFALVVLLPGVPRSGGTYAYGDFQPPKRQSAKETIEWNLPLAELRGDDLFVGGFKGFGTGHRSSDVQVPPIPYPVFGLAVWRFGGSRFGKGTKGRDLIRAGYMAPRPDTGRRLREFDPLRCRALRQWGAGDRTVYSAGPSADGKTLIAAGLSSGIGVWSLKTGKRLRVYSAAGGVYHASFANAGKWILQVGGGNNLVLVRDASTGGEVRRFDNAIAYLQTAAIDPQGRRIAISERDRICRVYDVTSGRLLFELAGHSQFIYAVAFSREGRLLATACRDKIRVWDVRRGILVTEFEGHRRYVYAMAFTPDGKSLVTGGMDGTVRLWRLASGREPFRFSHQGGNVTSVAVSPRGRWVAAASWDGTVRIWRVKDGRFFRRLEAHRGTAWSVRFHPDGERMITSGSDGYVRIWGQVGEGKE